MSCVALAGCGGTTNDKDISGADAILIDSAPDSKTLYGVDVALSGNELVVGAPSYYVNDIGGLDVTFMTERGRR